MSKRGSNSSQPRRIKVGQVAPGDDRELFEPEAPQREELSGVDPCCQCLGWTCIGTTGYKKLMHAAKKPRRLSRKAEPVVLEESAAVVRGAGAGGGWRDKKRSDRPASNTSRASQMSSASELSALVKQLAVGAKEVNVKDLKQPKFEFGGNFREGFSCLMCRRDDNEAKMVICDFCPNVWHMGCVDPPLKSIPANGWKCPSCANPDKYGYLLKVGRSKSGISSGVGSSQTGSDVDNHGVGDIFQWA